MSSLFTTTATHLPGQFLEVAQEMARQELANVDANNDPLTDNIQITYDTEAGTATVSVSLPISTSNVADGVSITADDFLP